MICILRDLLGGSCNRGVLGVLNLMTILTSDAVRSIGVESRTGLEVELNVERMWMDFHLNCGLHEGARQTQTDVQQMLNDGARRTVLGNTYAWFGSIYSTTQQYEHAILPLLLRPSQLNSVLIAV